MAAKDFNATAEPRHWRVQGGTIVADNGTDTLTLTNVDATITYTPGAREPVIPLNNGMLPANGFAGDENPSTIDYDFRLHDIAGADEWLTQVLTAPTGNTYAKFATLVIRNPDTKGAATGETITFNNVLRGTPGAVRGNVGGTEPDRVSGSLIALDAYPTIGTY